MKLKNSFLSLGIAMAAMGGVSGIAHADLLTYYNFNDAANTGGVEAAAAFTSDAGPTGTPATQTSTITTNFDNTTANITNFNGSAINGVTGETAGQSLAFLGGANNANNGKYFQFSFSATGQTNVGLSYATQRSSTGFTSQNISYSTDGTTFTNFFTNSSAPAAFAAFNTGPIIALDNAANVTFRFTFDGATAANGSARFDNIQVNSNVVVAPVPEPSTIALFVIGLGGMGFALRRKKSAESAEASGSALMPC